MEEEELIRRADDDPSPSPSPSAPLGRVLSTLFASSPRHLSASFSRVDSSRQKTSRVLLDDSLYYLRRYARDLAEKGEPFDHVLVPMVEHSLKFRGSKHLRQVLMILDWLFQDEFLFQALLNDLVDIILRKEDHYFALGWCSLTSALVEMAKNDTGMQGNYVALLKALCPSISRLSFIICEGSILRDSFELPTRLSIAAADCTLILTEALTRKAPNSETSNRSGSSDSKHKRQPVSLVSTRTENSIGKSSQGMENMELERALWEHLDDLIILVEKLQSWSKRGRPLHAKGLGQVLKWLKEIKHDHFHLQDEAGLDTGMLLLSSCWKHYVTLLRLEDHRFLQHYSEMLDQFLSALQFYHHNGGGDDLGKANSRTQTRKFFLNCISLLLGRLDGKQLGIAISECGPKLLNLLVFQLQSADEDMIEGSVEVLRLIFFKTNLESGSCLLETQQMEAVLPLLLNLLDQRDSAARAVVLLIAEFCALDPDGQCIREIFKRLEFGNNHQKRNAIDVVSELIRASSDSGNTLSPSIRKDIAKHLLECLVDEELVNYVQASNMFLLLDPPLVLPALVRLVYSSSKKVGVAASDAIIAILKHHNQNPDVIVLMIDCLSILSHGPGISETCGEIWEAIPRCSVQLKEGSKLDIDQVLRLIPQWSRSVKNWDVLIESLINKLFQEPSNATIVQFLSCISEDLAKAGELVLRCVLSHSWEEKEINANRLSCGGVKTPTSGKSAKYEKSLFNRLCPLLIIRLLPLRNFNDLNSPALYGDLPKHVPQVNVDGSTYSQAYSQATISALLINRAFASFEFEDVRKLAAELCGRLHPQVLLPIVDSHLEHAIVCRDILKMKSCLFAVCTSLVIRGRDTALNPVMIRIRKSLETVLLWPSLDTDEISKAQHGCIDCLALMICAEVQALESSQDVAVESSVLTYTIQQLTSDKMSENAACPLPFRLCMANVLISACQKVSSLGKHSLARRILPALLQSVKVMAESEVRAACLHVLFSAVYHLKSEVFPFTSELLKLSIKALKKGSEKERIAAAKLMASLMSSEEEIIESISTGLAEAKSVLAKIVATDSSPELQQLCRKLLLCITSPLEEAFSALAKNEL